MNYDNNDVLQLIETQQRTITELLERVRAIEQRESTPRHAIGDIHIDRTAPPASGDTVRYNGANWIYAP